MSAKNASDGGAADPLLRDGRDWVDPVLGMSLVWLDVLNLWVGRYAVTNDEYRAFDADHDSGEFDGHSLAGDQQPVARVGYTDGVAFCDWLTQKAKAAGALPDRAMFRLPSHEEWTAFARCGDGRTYPWGDEWPPTYGNYSDAAAGRAFPDWTIIDGYDDGHAVSCPVEESGENPWGLFGVGGNVYEWTFESGGTACELRGGSWSTNQQEYLTLLNRYRREPSSRLVNFGFRIVLTRL